MGLGADALLFAQYPLIWLGVPMAAWLGWIMWRIRSDRYSVVWWLLLALTILAAGLALENAFYPVVRVNRMFALGLPFLDSSLSVIAATFKALYVTAFVIAGGAIWELIVHRNSERRVAKRIAMLLAAVVVYGILVCLVLW